MLKRITLSLAETLEAQPGGCRTNVSTESYKRHLAMRVVPKCYLYVLEQRTLAPIFLLPASFYTSEIADLIVIRAFSTIVAETQFSALGIVLLSTLSRLTRATGIDHDMKSRPSAKELARGDTDSATLGREDLGEVVQRRDAALIPGHSVGIKNSDSVARPKHSKHSKPKSMEDTKLKAPKKKKRSKNAIDDLFEGLL